ncbi:MAG TPA: efflux RND transporter periplasmic adaptor subunit, partial [Burkholderiaceae bacterium]|nr:efflux RND transporter periplasmic adaptor subunit [Burkholderiaceae bacterium]
RDAKAPSAAPGGQTVPVAVVQVQPSTVQEQLQAVGSLLAHESVMLRPEVSGRIARIGFQEGQPVKRGQLLFALDDSVNVAEVAKAQAELDLARSQLQRTDDLARQAFVSGSAQETAQSNVQVLEADLRLARARLAKMKILAPFDGVAGIRKVSVGDFVREGSDLVSLEDVSVLKVDFRLPERNFAQVQVGQTVWVTADAWPQQAWQARLEAIDPSVEPGGRALRLRARLVNTPGREGVRLKPGMFVRVRAVVAQRDDALMVPEEAIVPSGSEFFVYKVVNDVARRERVSIGVRRDAQVEVTQGLSPGDVVVRLGASLVRDEQPVRVLPDEATRRQP